MTYESAIGGDKIEADALNLGRGGLFVLTEKPLAVGKRIELEIQVPGETTSWTALGRVIWARTRADGERKPPGMGVKLIDVEEEALEKIEHLVEVGDDARPSEGATRIAPLASLLASSEPTTGPTTAPPPPDAGYPARSDSATTTPPPGPGFSPALPLSSTPSFPPAPPNSPSGRAPAQAGVVTSPVVAVSGDHDTPPAPRPAVPERERTMLGVGAFPAPLPPRTPSTPPPHEVRPTPVVQADTPQPVAVQESMRPREASLAFDLVNKERTPSTPPPRPRPELRDEAPPQKALALPRSSNPPPAMPARAQGGRGTGWLLVAAFLAVAAAAVYWLVGGDSDRATRPADQPSAEPSTSTPVVRLPPSATETAASAAPPPPEAPAPSATATASAAASASASASPPAGTTTPVPVGLPRRVLMPGPIATMNAPPMATHAPAPATGPDAGAH